jgi:hypothetical protein
MISRVESPKLPEIDSWLAGPGRPRKMQNVKCGDGRVMASHMLLEEAKV